MRLLFGHKAGKGKPVVDSYGNQEVVCSLLDGTDQIVVILDSYLKTYYLNRLVSRFVIELYRGDNFQLIDDDDEWDKYHEFFSGKGLIPHNPIKKTLQ